MVGATRGRAAALHRLYAIACDWAGSTHHPSRAAVPPSSGTTSTTCSTAVRSVRPPDHGPRKRHDDTPLFQLVVRRSLRPHTGCARHRLALVGVAVGLHVHGHGLGLPAARDVGAQQWAPVDRPVRARGSPKPPASPVEQPYQETQVIDAALPSALDGYDFLFSATVWWKPFPDHAGRSDDASPALAVSSVVSRARQGRPPRGTRPTSRSTSWTGSWASCSWIWNERVKALAADVKLTLAPADRDRLRKLRSISARTRRSGIRARTRTQQAALPRGRRAQECGQRGGVVAGPS
ncbi:hypothetical protein SAVIM40S_00050 [Streptomyces avidinii]